MEDRYLFKAKRLDNGEWLEWDLISRIPENVSILADTICQSTGLRDKNGKLIWENDIVRDEYGNFYKAFWQNNYYQFSFCAKTGVFPIGAKWNLWSFKSSELEVVGNIFDDPELSESEGQYDRE